MQNLPILRHLSLHGLLAWALAALVGASQVARAVPADGDPVEALRQVLKDTVQDYAAREHRLPACESAVRELRDLRRALALQEWRDQSPERRTAGLDRAIR